jgi:hypothetical protein
MLKWLRKWFDAEAGAAARRAKQFLAARYPDFKVLWTVRRADEEARWVFAVMYIPPEGARKPPPYKLVAVSRDSCSVEEIEKGPRSPYRIPNYR